MHARPERPYRRQHEVRDAERDEVRQQHYRGLRPGGRQERDHQEFVQRKRRSSRRGGLCRPEREPDVGERDAGGRSPDHGRARLRPARGEHGDKRQAQPLPSPCVARKRPSRERMQASASSPPPKRGTSSLVLEDGARGRRAFPASWNSGKTRDDTNITISGGTARADGRRRARALPSAGRRPGRSRCGTFEGASGVQYSGAGELDARCPAAPSRRPPRPSPHPT